MGKSHEGKEDFPPELTFLSEVQPYNLASFCQLPMPPLPKLMLWTTWSKADGQPVVTSPPFSFCHSLAQITWPLENFLVLTHISQVNFSSPTYKLQSFSCCILGVLFLRSVDLQVCFNQFFLKAAKLSWICPSGCS